MTKWYWMMLSISLMLGTNAIAAAQANSADTQRPNIVVVLVDDMGFSDIGCYGSEIETPNIDRLAENGLRFSQFYNCGRCCPTRASLLTGLHPHQVGIGHMTEPPERPLGIEGPYQGYLNQNCATMAEVLKSAGYATMMTGKWHLGFHRPETHPIHRGFDQFYGGLSGAFNYFKPGNNRLIYEGEEVAETGADFYTTDAFTDRACDYIREASAKDDDQPFFLYLAYNAPHWPLNAKVKDFEKYRGKYRDGWAALSKNRQQRQKELGLFAGEVEAAPLVSPDWDSLNDGQRDRLDAVMAAYAGCIDSIDQNIGKLIRFLDEEGELDNTVIFFLSDNGACQEGGKMGHGGEPMVRNPPLETVNGVHLGLNWANACNTPFRKFKHFLHEGGACTPMIVHWPAGISAENRGAISQQFGYLPDFMATAVELSGAEYPPRLPQLVGKSLLPTLKDPQQVVHSEPIYWEHEGNAAMRIGDWKLVREYEKPWELFNLSNDRSELTNLSEQYPERAQQMQQMWEAWATEHQVEFPERFNMYRYLEKQKQQQENKTAK